MKPQIKGAIKKLQDEAQNFSEKIAEFLELDEIKKSHKKLVSSGLAENILKDYINKNSIYSLSLKYDVSTNLIYRLLTDFYLYTSDDIKLEEVVRTENNSHLNVLQSFFNSVSSLSQEIVFNAAFSKKLRKEIGEKLTAYGVEGVLEDRKLMYAWRESINRTEKLIKISTEQTNVYLSLLEKILDKQREVTFIKAVYTILQELEPSIAVKVQEALYKDEYARAIIEATTTEDLVHLLATTYITKNKVKASLSENSLEEDNDIIEDIKDE